MVHFVPHDKYSVSINYYFESGTFSACLLQYGQDGLLGEPPLQITVVSNIAAAPGASPAGTSPAAGATPATKSGDGALVPTASLARSPSIYHHR